jgi:hypothetical protein
LDADATILERNSTIVDADTTTILFHADTIVGDAFPMAGCQLGDHCGSLGGSYCASFRAFAARYEMVVVSRA